MQISNTLLVIIDPTVNEHPALAQATVLAKKLKLELELFICDDNQPFTPSHVLIDPEILKKYFESELTKHEEYLEKLALPLQEQGLQVSWDVARDIPLYEGIVHKAESSRPFMVIKDTHYHHKLTRVVLQNTDWSLIRTCPVPLMLVRPGNLWRTPVVISSIDPIDVRNDGVKLDEAILQLGRKLSSLTGGSLHVFHDCGDLEAISMALAPYGGTYSEVFSAEEQAKIREEHKRAVYEVTDKFDIERGQITVEAKDIRKSLAEFAEKINADLVVMGSVSKSRLEQVFIGGTTERVLDELNCDVLVLKPDSFQP